MFSDVLKYVICTYGNKVRMPLSKYFICIYPCFLSLVKFFFGIIIFSRVKSNLSFFFLLQIILFREKKGAKTLINSI